LPYICGATIYDMGQPNDQTNNMNSFLLKAIGWIAGISGVLVSIIGMLLLGEIRDMKTDLKDALKVGTENTIQMTSINKDITTIRGEIEELKVKIFQPSNLFATKVDEITVPKRRRQTQ